MRGFADRAALSAAWAWLDEQPAAMARQMAPLERAAGRVLAAEITVPLRLPGPARAALDGYAVRAADCDGANAYNPLVLGWREGVAVLPQGAASPVAAGWPLPSGADAVLPFEAAERTGAGWLTVLAPVAVSAGVDHRGHGLQPGATLLAAGRVLRPQDLACLGALGVGAVPVLQRPRVRLLVPGPKSGADVLTPMLLSLLARDGADIEALPLKGQGEQGLATALSQPCSGITLIAGRSGAGPDDLAASAVRACGGRLAFHGVALQPGGSAGLATLSAAPLILLPGDPFACLAAYDMLAARLIRRLSALPASPYAVASFVLARKIVSGIGLAEIIPVMIAGNLAYPVSGEHGVGALRADGFVMVAEAAEGYPSGTAVPVRLYGAPETGPDFAYP